MLEVAVALLSKKVAKLPKAARAALAGTLVYTTAVGIVNIDPKQLQYVPVLSSVTPVLAEVTQGGVTRTELISHAEFTRLNAEGAQLQQVVREIEQELAFPYSGYSYTEGRRIDFVFDTSAEHMRRGLNRLTYEDGSVELIMLKPDGTFVSEVTVDGERDAEVGFWEHRGDEYVLFSEGLQTHLPYMALVEDI
ncbi:hypothetical protein [Synechococcus phage S-B68]|nr:hypothetical protein [Synechococcus phage S-B68]